MLILIGVADAMAVDTYWQHDAATPGDWFEPENWTNGLPVYGLESNALIDNGGTVEISGGIAERHKLYVGYNNTGHVVQTGGVSRSYPFYAGAVLLGYHTDSYGTYSLSGGLLQPHNLEVGFWGEGVFHQADGDIFATAVTVGYYTGTSRYIQTGGETEVTSVLSVGNGQEANGEYVLEGSGNLRVRDDFMIGHAGIGGFTQSGGEVLADEDLFLGTRSSSEGTYAISAGTLDVDGALNVGWGGTGTFRVIGGEGEIFVGSYWQAANRGSLASVIDVTGVSTISVSGSAQLAGTWTVEDYGAGLGRFDVLVAGEPINSEFSSVLLPGADWSWGIENGTTLWVQHVPEPFSLVLLLTGLPAFTVFGRRRKWAA